jgi:ribosomal protein S18 acetylase RimI-like enzyme
MQNRYHTRRKKYLVQIYSNITLRIRPANEEDRQDVLKFCTDTFEWGDYIDQVWDLWYLDRNGLLIVVEEGEQENNILRSKRQSSVIAVSHVSLCPNRNIWLEGIRVNPNYRRRSIATALLNKMISYGKERGAREASAVVASNNIASQLMMEKKDFVVISKWNYYSINKIPKRVGKLEASLKVATLNDIEMICNYLRQSETYKSSGQTYVSSWRWYSLDLYSNALPDLVKNKKVLVIENERIEGVAIINKDIPWNINNNNIFQIVYLDASDIFLLEEILSFAIDLIHSEGEIYEKIQVFSPQATYISTVMQNLGIESPEQFLLYRRKI